MMVTLLMTTPPLVPVLGSAAAGIVRKAEQRSGVRKKRREKGRGGGGRGGRGSLMPNTWRVSYRSFTEAAPAAGSEGALSTPDLASTGARNLHRLLIVVSWPEEGLPGGGLLCLVAWSTQVAATAGRHPPTVEAWAPGATAS
jgi:hypothetical protein